MATSESTTQASAWRLHLARGIGDVNGSHRNVTAVAVVGSVSRGTADRYSDLEIATFWRVPPTEEERHALASQAGGANWRSFPWNDLGTEEWSDDYELNGLKIDGLHYTVVTAERLLADVLERFDTSLPRQLFAGSVHHARVLHGEQLIQGWQARTADYPVELARALVREYLRFGPSSWVEMLAKRNDLMVLHEILVAATKNVLGILIGLNRLYHPGYKHLQRTIAEMRIVPDNLFLRIEEMLRAAPADGARRLEQLIEEVIGLVEQDMPEVETRGVRERLAQGRSPVDAPLANPN